jgi:SET domain-containing protein
MWYINKSDIHGNGVFASENISKGTKIDKVAHPKMSGLYEITKFGSMVNHQSKDNCELRFDQDHCYWLYALVDILQGSELVSDYKKTLFPFDQKIDGFKERK